MKRFGAPPHFLYFSLIFAQSTVNENVSVAPGVAGTTAPATGELSLMSGEGGRSARAEPPRATAAARERSVGRKRGERFMGVRPLCFRSWLREGVLARGGKVRGVARGRAAPSRGGATCRWRPASVTRARSRGRPACRRRRPGGRRRGRRGRGSGGSW